jgi:uncharacterized membrane protein YgcG
LAVDPTHLKHLRQTATLTDTTEITEASAGTVSDAVTAPGAERRRRIRDAVEAALSDVVLLGTDEQVRLAAHAANEMVAGHKVDLAELVASLRNFIRKALDLEPIPAGLLIPDQGPLRPSTSGGRGGGGGAGGANRSGGGGDKGGGMDGGMGAGIGAGGGVNSGHESTEPTGTPPDEAHR